MANVSYHEDDYENEDDSFGYDTEVDPVIHLSNVDIPWDALNEVSNLNKDKGLATLGDCAQQRQTIGSNLDESEELDATDDPDWQRQNEGDLNDNDNPGEGKWLIINSYERTCKMPQTEHYKTTRLIFM